jgi:flagellar biosynthesis protein FlhG
MSAVRSLLAWLARRLPGRSRRAAARIARERSVDAAPRGRVSPPDEPLPGRSRIVCVTSGKGGTGKSVIATNLAVYAASHGLRVLLLDADLGLANAHLLLSISPAFNLSHVLAGGKKIEDVVEKGPFGLELVSGGSGVSELAALDELQLRSIVRELSRVARGYDLVVVDTSAGIAPQTMAFLYAATEVLLVTTPDVTAMTDAYAIVKTLHRHATGTAVRLVVNKSHSPEEAHAVHERISRVSEKFLKRPVPLLGFVLFDRSVGRSIVVKDPVVHSFPKSPAARGIAWIAQHVVPVSPRPAPAVAPGPRRSRLVADRAASRKSLASSGPERN